jgi:hypothetical protein
MICFIFKAFICHLLLIPAQCEHLQLYTNHFVAEINGGKGEARDLARKYSLRLMPTVRNCKFQESQSFDDKYFRKCIQIFTILWISDSLI